MRLPRQYRILSALVTLVSVLFTQVAVASFVCTSKQIAHAMGSEASSPVAEHHHVSSSEEMDSGGKTFLCHAHGQIGSQSLDKPELPSISPFVASMLVQTLAYSAPAPQAAGLPPADLLLTRTTAPPLSIRNCCFRI